MSRFTARGLGVALLAVALAASTRAQPACPDQTFLQPGWLPIEGSPQGVGLADFNEDTFVDVVLTGEYFGIAIFAGAGDGTFGAPVGFSEGVGGESLIAADLNGDLHVDIAVGAYGTIYVFLGHGDGTFEDPQAYPATGGSISTLVAGKFDGDDVPDLAVITVFGVSVLINDGDGTFADPVPYEVPHSNLQSVSDIAGGDVDGDGLDDIVAVGSDIWIFRNAGNGTFEAAYAVVEGPGLHGVAAGDVDGDGILDIGVVRGGYGSSDGTWAGILRGVGGGAFEAALETWVGENGTRMHLADVDGDGRDDALVLSGSSQFGVGAVGILRAQTGADLGPATQYAAAGVSLRSLAAADLDGDGLLDVVTAGAGGASVLLGNGGGRLRTAAGAAPPWGVGQAAPGDFDGDGLVDLVIGGYSNITMAFLPGNGDGTFADPRPIDNSEYPPGVLAGDFDDDGRLDLAVAGFYQTRIQMGRGDGSFEPGQALTDFAAVDSGVFTTSGHRDLLARSPSSWDILVRPGNGDGTFGDPVSNAASVYDGGFSVGRFNGDALDDIVFIQTPGGQETGTLRVWLSNGDGTFTESYTHDSVSNTPRTFLADLNGDGFLDILAAESADGTRAYFGHGDGDFDDPVVIDPAYPLGAVAADFEGDGHVDILTTNVPSAAAMYFRGLGGGAFAPGEPVPVYNLAAGAVASFTGSPDVLSITNGGWAILLNSHLSPTVGSRSVVTGRRATLRVAASGVGALSYQWRKGGVPLSDAGTISGSQTPILTIDPVEFGDAGTYDVVVNDACSEITSNAATLSVEFGDVPVSSLFHDDIITIATDGITGGCGSGNYCPTSPVRRDQMAAFLLKSEHGSAYTPPACTGVFDDVPCPGPFTDWIEQLAAEGVTAGCGTDIYCPSQSVTRAQMAIFLLKTSEGSGYGPPPATGIFGDVPVGSFAADFIEDLYNKGITGGCSTSPLLYCPGNAVLRQQMATFLVRTFSP